MESRVTTEMAEDGAVYSCGFGANGRLGLGDEGIGVACFGVMKTISGWYDGIGQNKVRNGTLAP